MKRKIGILSGLLVLAFSLSSSVAAFQDTNSLPVQWVSDMGIMGGYPDGTFQPLHTITRNEIAVVMARLLEPEVKIRFENEVKKRVSFSDVPIWSQWAVSYGKERGVISGYPNGTFKGNKPVTWGEFSAIFLRSFFEMKKEKYPDDYMKKMKNLGITVKSDKQNITRYEVAWILHHLAHSNEKFSKQMTRFGYLQTLSEYARLKDDDQLLQLLMLSNSISFVDDRVTIFLDDREKTNVVYPTLWFPTKTEITFKEGKAIAIVHDQIGKGENQNIYAKKEYILD